MKIRIENAVCNYVKEPLKNAFGFKGSALTCLWQTVVLLEAQGKTAMGAGVQSVLWSDASVFKSLGEEDGNKAMFGLTKYATDLCMGAEFEKPSDIIDDIFPQVYDYAKKLIKSEKIRTTFVLNSLVALDLALWQLWARVNNVVDFDRICTFDGEKQNKLTNIPLITYRTPIEDVKDMAINGTALFKIKIGSDPLKNNDLDEMLRWDKNRILEIHNAVKDIRTPYTENGKVLYYLDANGRYDTKERLMELLTFAEENKILERIVLFEEPFDEDNKTDVSDVPVCIAADESAHSLDDVMERFELGYRALTLKPIAKTLSVTIKMADFARKKGMICFCADLTVNPVMVSWNQCVASRLKTIPGMKIGVVESNGEQNYVNWSNMIKEHPCYGKSFVECKDGVFNLGEDFYECSGGVFETSKRLCEIISDGGNV